MDAQGEDNEIRNLGYVAWKNNLSWLEEQSGPRWASFIKRENNNMYMYLEILVFIEL